jgi:hypothetical protein
VSVTQWSGYAYQAQAQTGIPAPILLGLIDVESDGVPGRVSKAGAGGITQFMPGTAPEYGVDVRPGHEWSQVLGAARYLDKLGFKKDPTKALASYNAGPGNWRAGLTYAGNVLAAAKAYAGSVSPNSGQATKSDSGSIAQAAAQAQQTSADRGPWALRQLLGLTLVVGGLALVYFGGARVLGVSGAKPIRNGARAAAVVMPK